MATYPIEISNNEGQVEAINYLLSGPSGLGQNFTGANGLDKPSWTKGSQTEPYTADYLPFPILYVAPISLSSGTYLDERTVEFTFTTPQGTLSEPVFRPGEIIYVDGTSVAAYNKVYYGIGVVKCNTTTVTVRLTAPANPIPADCTGGVVSKDFTYDTYTSPDFLADIQVRTDLVAYATVTGPTDRVAINSHMVFNAQVKNIGAASDGVAYFTRVNRYVGSPNISTSSPKYLFTFDTTIAQYGSSLTVAAGVLGSTGYVSSSYAGLLDNPPPGYYMYCVEFLFVGSYGDAKLYRLPLYSRSITVQVIKQ